MKQILFSMMVTFFMASQFSTAPMARAGEIELEDYWNAKLSRSKADARARKNQDEKDGGLATLEEEEAEQDCGNVSIGNVKEERFGIPKRETFVFVDGPVVNSADCQ
jgi:hypothetical protein